MLLKEKFKVGYINILISNKFYKRAIEVIDSLITDTTAIRKLINLKVFCLIELGNYEEAIVLYDGYLPYLMFDDEDLKTIKNLEKTYLKLGNKILYNKYKNSYNILSMSKENRKAYIYEYDKKVDPIYRNFLSDNISFDKVIEYIIIDNLEMTKLTETAVYIALAKKEGIKLSEDIYNVFKKYTHANNFVNEIFKNKENIYCVISKTNELMYLNRDMCLVKALSRLGSLVYHILPSLELNNGVSISKNNNITTITLESKVDTIDKVIASQFLNKLNKENNTNKPILVLGDTDLIMDINEDIKMSKVLQMNYRHYEEQPIQKKDCLLLGDYLNSMSYIFDSDIKKEFSKEPTYDFSIIIPVRNSIKYLSETISTCLNQDYRGSYEILISDNSVDRNLDIKKLVDNIGDSKIRYIRTPYDLSLSKSFEYAYLNAKGRYLISIGSDDGMTRKALSKLHNIIKDNPSSNIFMWNAPLYYWPSYPDPNLAYKLIIKEHPSILNNNTIISKDLIRKIALARISYLFGPNLYLLTCIKKEHIYKIIELTGKFEDGDSQDVYTGMVNLFIEKEIIFVDYPIVLAGNSEIGIGINYKITSTSPNLILKSFDSYKSYYRYLNYYSSEYRNLMNYFSFGDSYLVFKEFIKLKRFNFIEDVYSNKDIFIALRNGYYNIAYRNKDNELYLNNINRIAKSQGVEFYEDFSKDFRRWKIDAKIIRLFLGKIRNKEIKKVLSNIYEKVRILLKYNDTIGPSKIQLKTKQINLDNYNIEGIKDAIDFLENSINNQ